MTVILAIDTATPAVTAGVVPLDGIEVLAERVTVDARAHAEQLTPNVLAALADAGLTMADLDAVVVGCGPARSPACGSGWPPPRPTVTRSAFRCTGSAASMRSACDTGDVLVVTDARRREVYWARYRDGVRVDGPAVNARPTCPALLRPWPARRSIRRRRAWCARWPTGRPSLRRWFRCICAGPTPSRSAGGDPMTVALGPLTRTDAERCAELEAQLFDGDDPWPARAFLPELAAKHNHYVAARADDTLVGYGGISRLGRKPPFEYEIHTIGVDPAYQGQGIGRRLLDELLEHRRRWNGLPRGPHRQRSGDRAVRERRVCQSRRAQAVLPSQRRRRLHDATGSAMTIILAIESSCDETGVGIARLDADGTVTLLADEVASSVDEHVRFGGVVPEIASRAHLEALGPTMRRALATAGVDKPDIVAATIGPGLAGALLVGVAAAKAYSAAWEVPFYAVNHLGGHLAADVYDHGPLPESVACWCPAATPTCCTCGRSASRSSNSAAPSTTPPARPTTRWPGCSASAIRAARCSTTWPAPATATRSCSRAA